MGKVVKSPIDAGRREQNLFSESRVEERTMEISKTDMESLGEK